MVHICIHVYNDQLERIKYCEKKKKKTRKKRDHNVKFLHCYVQETQKLECRFKNMEL